MTLTLQQAQSGIKAAVEKAESLGVASNVAVLDAAAHLMAFARMDHAILGSIDVSIRKAKTAALFGFDSKDLGQYSQPGGPFYMVELSNGGLISFGGGVPVKDDSGRLIGAIGSSGGSLEQDEAVAKAGRDAIAAMLHAS